MSENELASEDEISLHDLSEKLLKGWRYLIGGVVLGLLVAVLVIALVAPKYEAIAIMQVGQVSSQPVEPAAQAVERMKNPAFQMEVATGLGDQAWIDDLKKIPGTTPKIITLQLVKTTAAQLTSPLLELKANGSSPEYAKAIAEVAIAVLAKRHAELAKPLIQRMQADLAIAKEKMVSAEKELQAINKLTVNAGVKDERFTQLSLMTSLRVQKEAELFSQRQAVTALETALSAPATQPAKAIEAVFVADMPIFPKKGLLLGLGLSGGLLVGVVAIFFSNMWRRRGGNTHKDASS